jgi:MarR-like DNA-binding transcriptional regulator SgrR of sgrS sRNA
MKHFVWRWLASSVIVAMLAVGIGCASAAQAETRPQYGGTLHVAMRAAPASLDPVDITQPDSLTERSLTLLMFDTLVTSGDNGRAQSALATAWQTAGSRRWQFRIRRGVKFHDGTPLTPDLAAASLRAANPMWNISADADSLVIERDGAEAELLAELALPRNAIAKRNSSNKPDGTGPFSVADWQPGKKLTLAADENYWRGRPFLDGIVFDMGRSYRDQMTALELGTANLVEVAAEQSHRASVEGRRLENSEPIELLALFFAREAQSPEDKLLRQALALSIERGSIHSVLLQGTGQPAASILPNWMSGYSFVFSAEADLSRARQARTQVRAIPTWSFGYDGSDPVARLVAERIALNARDAGLLLQPSPQSMAGITADVRLLRIPLVSADPWVALTDVAARAGLAAFAKEDGSAEALYSAERAVLAAQRIIPLFHLPVSYAASAALKNWAVLADGSLQLDDAWMGNGKP